MNKMRKVFYFRHFHPTFTSTKFFAFIENNLLSVTFFFVRLPWTILFFSLFYLIFSHTFYSLYFLLLINIFVIIFHRIFILSSIDSGRITNSACRVKFWEDSVSPNDLNYFCQCVKYYSWVSSEWCWNEWKFEKDEIERDDVCWQFGKWFFISDNKLWLLFLLNINWSM